MIYIRPFRISDYDAFVPIEPLDSNEVRDPELAQAVEDSGLSVTGVRDGKVVGCGGVHPTDDEDVGILWLRLSTTCLKHKLDTLRWISDGLKIIEETYPFKEVRASVQCCFESSAKLVDYLGFKKIQQFEDDGKIWYVYSKRIQE